jgi:2-methylcitrate dehydratase PrpD
VDTTQTLAGFASKLAFDDIPAQVRQRSALLLLDLWGIIIRARHDAESSPCVLSAAHDLGWHGGSCSVIGDRDKYTPAGAAFLNATFAHTLDFDDTHAVGSLHPSASVVPAAIAAAELADADGRTLVAGIVAGYEAVCRISHALVPAEHYDRGFHPSATAGAFGAAVAASRVLELDPDGVATAMGAVLSFSAGTMQFLSNGSWNKRIQLGGAAMNGLLAACLARRGFHGAAEPIEGQYGFLHAYAPNPMAERATADLGSRWETMEIGVKPYPSCRFTHAAVDVVLDAIRENGLRVEDVESIIVGLPRKSMDIVAIPEARKRRPCSVVEAQFSVHFGVAVALREGQFGWDDYAVHVGNAQTEALSDRISAVQDPEADALYPEHLPAVVEIRTKAGTTRKLVTDPKGEPSNWATEQELRDKLVSLAAPYLGNQQTAALADRILDVAALESISELVELSHPPLVQRGAAE